MSKPRPAIRSLRERKERHQQRGRFYRVAFALIGVLLILLGIVLIPLPGPGWLIVALPPIFFWLLLRRGYAPSTGRAAVFFS
jgi:uncharacterized membrane protein YccC